MIDDDGIIAIYSQELITLAEEANTPQRLENPAVSAVAVNPICGSEVTVDLVTHGDTVTKFGFEVEACALTKSVVAVMNKNIIGATRADIAKAGQALRAMLQGQGLGPVGRWEKLQILMPVRDFPARHEAILLPFEAVEKAFQKAFQKTCPTP